MTSRFAVGSVSTLAMGALLLGSASFWLNRPGASSQATPWGDISSLSPAHAAAAQTDDQAQLLKLAALKSGGETTATAAAPPALVSAPPSPSESVQASVAADVPTPTAPVPQTADAAPANPPVQMAAAEDPAPAEPPAPAEDSAAAKSNLINLNKASADALDRMGAGHVGRTIVAHRPYRSVKDLVSRRVLRTSDYQKIASRLSVD